MRSLAANLLVLAVLATACSSSGETTARNPDTAETTTTVSDETTTTVANEPFEFAALPVGEQVDFGSPPPILDTEPSEEVTAALEEFFGPTLGDGIFLASEWAALDTITATGDVRYAWLFSDLLRIAPDPDFARRLSVASGSLMGIDVGLGNPWADVTDHLIAWNVPAPPDYLTHKRAVYTLIEPGWDDLFVESDLIDWRHVSWGGVRIDARPFDTTDDPCNCIPAADNPETQIVAEATWLEPDDVVFGVVINGEARAYPRQIMEVREMVNDTLGGRDFAMPYCTLCGSAQVYFTDELPDGVDRPVLRTSGLLIRSNKVMYDFISKSVFDTFTGEAVTGPLSEQGLVLSQASVVTATWANWSADHPDSTVLIEELALGRDFDFRNGRDADGPIFPIGDVDPRLPVQEDVVGVITESGTPVAFHLASAVAALEAGQTIEVENVQLQLDAGGVRAVDGEGTDLGGHQAFWFAWSQFYPETELWPALP